MRSLFETDNDVNRQKRLGFAPKFSVALESVNFVEYEERVVPSPSMPEYARKPGKGQ